MGNSRHNDRNEHVPSLNERTLTRLRSFSEALETHAEGLVRVPAGTPTAEVQELPRFQVGIEQIFLGSRRSEGEFDVYRAVFHPGTMLPNIAQDAAPDWFAQCSLETASGIRIHFRRVGD